MPCIPMLINPIKAHSGEGSWPFSESSATFPPQADHVSVDFSSMADGGLCGQSSPTVYYILQPLFYITLTPINVVSWDIT